MTPRTILGGLAFCALLWLLVCSVGFFRPAHGGKPQRSVPAAGLLAPDSTYRILRAGGSDSHYPYLRSWVEPDTMRFLEVIWMADSVQRDSSPWLSVADYRRVQVFLYRKNGLQYVDLVVVR